MFGGPSPPSICWPCGSRSKTVPLPWVSIYDSLHGSQTRTLFYEGLSTTLLFLLKKALHLLHFLTTARSEWRENVWKELPLHPFLLSSTQWFKILKRYFLGRAIHTVYFYDNTVRSDPYLTLVKQQVTNFHITKPLCFTAKYIFSHLSTILW